MKFFNRNLSGIILLIILSFWTISPLLNPGFFPMHDDTQPSRVYEMSRSLVSGQFPVRIVNDLGYGYGYLLFNFYAPFPYYIGAFFNILGFDVITSAKLMFAIGVILAGISMYWLVKETVGKTAGLVSGLLYMYVPYHAVDIYVRGAVGELYAMGFIPLFVLGIYKLLFYNQPVYHKTKRIIIHKDIRIRRNLLELKTAIFISVLGLSGILLSHNVFGLITLYFSGFGILAYFLYVFIRKNNPSQLLPIVTVFLLSIGISAFFLLPAVFEKKYTNVETLISGGSNYRLHFVNLDQLWDSTWGFGGSAIGRADGMSFKVGKIHLVLGIISSLYLYYLYRKKKISSFHFLFFTYIFFIFIISIFLMLESSGFVWSILPGFPYIQYPWRFLGFTAFSLSYMISVLFIGQKFRSKILLTLLIIPLTLWLNIKYFIPQRITSSRPSDYMDYVSLRYKISKISDEYLPKNFPAPSKSDDLSLLRILYGPEIIISQEKDTPAVKSYRLTAPKPASITTHLAYFPGWQAFIDDNKRLKLYDDSGLIKVNIPQGTHTLILKFADTPIRTVANTISFLSIFLLVYVSLFWDGKIPCCKINLLK